MCHESASPLCYMVDYSTFVYVEWIQLARVRGRWQAVVNTVMNLVVLAPRNCVVCLYWLLFYVLLFILCCVHFFLEVSLF
jgi:hypothetical protein